jgi:FkbM family methyltransferase
MTLKTTIAKRFFAEGPRVATPASDGWLLNLVALARRTARRLVLPPEEAVVNFDDFFLSLSRVSSSLREYTESDYERYTTSLIRQNIRRGDVVIDVGAQIGYFTVIAAQCVGDQGCVYAIEPEPRNLYYLRKNIEQNGVASRVRVVPKAVGDRRDMIELFLYQGSDSHSFVKHPTAPVRDIVRVETVRLDDELAGAAPNLIKIDIEGYEMHALAGLQRLLQQPSMNALIIEMVPAFLKNAGSSAEALRAHLVAAGFDIQVIDEKRETLAPLDEAFMKSTNPRDYANLLCRPRRHGA